MHSDARTRGSLRHQTMEDVGPRIINGDYPPGHRFASQDGLSVEFGVSRTVVREALGLLRDKGLIESRPKSGTIVADRRSWNVLDPDVLRWSLEAAAAPATLADVAEVRLVIEPAAARLAARRRTNEAADELLDLYRALAEAVSDFDQYIVADLALHDAIFAAAANPVLARMAETVRVALEGARRVSVHVPGGPATTLELHFEVVSAVRRQDEDEAERVMAELIDVSTDDLLKMLRVTAQPPPGEQPPGVTGTGGPP